MATTRTVTVKTSGGDYTSLSNAEAGEQGDLVSLDRQLTIECYAKQDGATDVDGSTTDATRYISIFVPSTERHAGKWDSSKYRVIQNVNWSSSVLRLLDPYTRVEGVQCHQTGTTSAGYAALSIQAENCTITACICRSNGTASNRSAGIYLDGGGTGTIRNTICYEGRYGISDEYLDTGKTLTVENCTLVGSSDYGLHRNAGSGTLVVKNTYSGGNGSSDYNGTMTFTTCASSDATSRSGVTASIAYSTSTFVNVTAGSEDLHLVSGSALIDAGTDLSASFTTDIDGATRSGTWDIGADEYVSTGPAIPVFMNQYRQRWA